MCFCTVCLDVYSRRVTRISTVPLLPSRKDSRYLRKRQVRIDKLGRRRSNMVCFLTLRDFQSSAERLLYVEYTQARKCSESSLGAKLFTVGRMRIVQVLDRYVERIFSFHFNLKAHLYMVSFMLNNQVHIKGSYIYIQVS